MKANFNNVFGSTFFKKSAKYSTNVNFFVIKIPLKSLNIIIILKLKYI